MTSHLLAAGWDLDIPSDLYTQCCRQIQIHQCKQIFKHTRRIFTFVLLKFDFCISATISLSPVICLLLKKSSCQLVDTKQIRYTNYFFRHKYHTISWISKLNVLYKTCFPIKICESFFVWRLISGNLARILSSQLHIY